MIYSTVIPKFFNYTLKAVRESVYTATFAIAVNEAAGNCRKRSGWNGPATIMAKRKSKDLLEPGAESAVSLELVAIRTILPSDGPVVRNGRSKTAVRNWRCAT